MHNQGVSVVAKKKYTEEEARERKNARERERKARLRSEGKMGYRDPNYQYVNIYFSSTLYDDVLEYLETRRSKSEYIKSLIRFDLKQKKYTMEFPKKTRGAQSESTVRPTKKTICVVLKPDADADIIDILSQCKNKPAYIAKLVRRDIFKKKVGILEDD